MDMKRKKELLNEWKNRRPEMGLIAITCKSTGEMFVGISTDTQFAFNSHRSKLSANAAYRESGRRCSWNR